ncbi:hypothetical protein [Nonomuraea typhae]|uniref:Uncharacterized protein n=1 Tax=Nonomuraea typhae TaxID=2603600 RepID=A0ABW7YNM2_9ACTN
MADTDIPEDLLDLKIKFLQHEGEYPKNAELAAEIHRHSWLADAGGERHARWMALQKAARDALAAPAV